MKKESKAISFLKSILIALSLKNAAQPKENEMHPPKVKLVVEGSSRNYTEEAKQLKYLHLRSEDDPNIAVTIGYLYDRTNKHVDYQVARCSHGDVFCKRIGRAIASGRYAKYGPGWVLENVNNDADVYDQLTMLWHPDGDAIFALEERL